MGIVFVNYAFFKEVEKLVLICEFLKILFVTACESAKFIFNLYFNLPHNLPDVLVFAIKQKTILSNISWLNDLLFLIVSGLSFLITFIIASKFNRSSKNKSVLSFFVFVISVWMFNQIWFWIIVAVFAVLIISYSIYAIYKKKKGGENYDYT